MPSSVDISREKSITALNSFSSLNNSSVISSAVAPSKLRSGEGSEGGGGGGGEDVGAADDSGSLELLSVETLFRSFCFFSFSSDFGVVIGEVWRAFGQVRLLCPVLWQILHLRDIIAFLSWFERGKWPEK